MTYVHYAARDQPRAVLRLASGHLCVAGDFHHFDGRAPAPVAERGAYGALSGHEGRTWQVRPPEAPPHEPDAGSLTAA